VIQELVAHTGVAANGAGHFKALAPGAKPRYDTILKVVRALGVTLRATPTPP